MKAKLIVEGKEFDLEILDEELQQIVSKTRKNGYERVGCNSKFFCITPLGRCLERIEEQDDLDDTLYSIGNYFSDKNVAENNMRAEQLMRQLRRFAIENRRNALDWNDNMREKWSIFYNFEHKRLDVSDSYTCCEFNSIYFDTQDAAWRAADIFCDELLWYFTEYKDSL